MPSKRTFVVFLCAVNVVVTEKLSMGTPRDRVSSVGQLELSKAK